MTAFVYVKSVHVVSKFLQFPQNMENIFTKLRQSVILASII